MNGNWVAGGLQQLISMETVLFLTGWNVPTKKKKKKIDTTTTKQPTNGYVLPCTLAHQRGSVQRARLSW